MDVTLKLFFKALNATENSYSFGVFCCCCWYSFLMDTNECPFPSLRYSSFRTYTNTHTQSLSLLEFNQKAPPCYIGHLRPLSLYTILLCLHSPLWLREPMSEKFLSQLNFFSLRMHTIAHCRLQDRNFNWINFSVFRLNQNWYENVCAWADPGYLLV